MQLPEFLCSAQDDRGLRRGFTLIDPGCPLRGDKSVQRKAGKSGFTLIELLVVIPLVPRRKPARRGFTLIELLVVIAIVAVLAVVVVLVLNPAQLIQQSRDSNRISDMASLNSALSLYLADAALSGTVSLGSSSVVYVSVPDPSATSTAGDQCQGLGLPSLPATYSYHCAASSTFRMANAIGWIPVNFAGMSNGSPLGQLPIDPTNSTSSRLYYTYTTNGSQYEITAVPESSKYKLGGSSDVISPDGGTLASVFEKGSRLGLEPLDYGDSSLVGLWTFEEGSSSIAYDYSGSNATSSWIGTPVGTAGYYSAGKIGSWAGAFDGSTTYTATASNFIGKPTVFSVSVWINLAATQQLRTIFSNYYTSASNSWVVGISDSAPNKIKFYLGSATLTSSSTLSNSTWYNVVATYNNGNPAIYINGVLDATAAGTIVYTNTPDPLNIGRLSFGSQYFGGFIDDVRYYTRALSAAEITAIYNGGK